MILLLRPCRSHRAAPWAGEAILTVVLQWRWRCMWCAVVDWRVGLALVEGRRWLELLLLVLVVVILMRHLLPVIGRLRGVIRHIACR